ncbi:AP-5 complex subunit beta-1 [Oncorhynchus kisutch]|uniref:AP-5 complex subunit beta-1 n=1 Tax=Oncorhynchus kisutch TaxID=8019 RepID=A0A8C7KH57_ONCKI|nr:AP-5 complex subunit beta-1 [Oncorhynchus kisutch]
MSANWPERISAFLRSPSQFLCSTTSDIFLAEVLHELRDDRASDHIKVLLLSPLLEHPTLLCPSVFVGEETALELMSVFAQCSPKSLPLRCHLLLALTSVLLCSCCVSSHTSASQDFLDLLLQMAQDTNDAQAGAALHPLRTTACDCLRELEACLPGLLSQRLELLSSLRQQENSRLHQAYTGLHALALRNAVYLLTQQKGAGAGDLKTALGSNEGFVWGEGADSAHPNSESHSDLALFSPLTLGTMGKVPSLQTGLDCKELRSLLSSLLEESYLLTSLSQAALLRRLVEVLAMVPAVSPTIFRAQLLRLLGTCKVCLLHTTLLMKAAFTDSLFSAEDEAFLLKRLVGLSQHPLLSTPEKLFYMDCILHFPENRPISSGDESLPVLLTPRLAAALVPTVFNDSVSMLARLNLLSLVYLEEGEEDREGQGGRGLAYLYDHLTSLLRIVENQASREMVVTFFRASFLFLLHFCHVERYSEDLSQRLCDLYLRRTRLAPHLINLADRTQDRLEESGWAVALLRALQRTITEAPLSQLTLQDLRWHLRILARVAEEGEVLQRATLNFLLCVITSSSSALCVSGDWRLGNSVLGVCRRLLLHPSLDSLLTPLADLLQHLTCHYGETDIQDHARLYYTLLTTLSQEKLAGVLAQRGTERGRQAKVRSLSAIMGENEELTSGLTVHQTERPLLRLVKLDKHEPDECRPEHKPDSEPACETESSPGQGGIEDYRAQFQSSSFASEITLQYHLTHTGVHDPHFDKLFSIRLHFDLTDGHYEEVSDISVPCLFRTRKPPTVRLRLKPKQPYHTTLRASAIFTTEDGLSWHSPLADLHVAFPEVFLPLLTPLGWAREKKQRVFEGIWVEICSGQSEGDLTNTATSLFCDQLEDSAVGELVEKYFQRYLVSDLDKGRCKVLFFLPPQSHVLLKVITEEDAVQVHIATDNWKLLPYINSYLEDITKEIHSHQQVNGDV